MKVLLLEDDADQLAIRVMLLHHAGFQALPAEDSQTATSLARQHLPECAVLDLRSPTPAAGLAVLRHLRETYPDMHLLVLTGYSPDHPSVTEAAIFADAVFTKGTGAAVLLDRLAEIRRTGSRTDKSR